MAATATSRAQPAAGAATDVGTAGTSGHSCRSGTRQTCARRLPPLLIQDRGDGARDQAAGAVCAGKAAAAGLPQVPTATNGPAPPSCTEHTPPQSQTIPSHHPSRPCPSLQLGILGSGTYGLVIRARDTSDPDAQDVAIKLLPRGGFVSAARPAGMAGGQGQQQRGWCTGQRHEDRQCRRWLRQHAVPAIKC